ncbi:DUF4332 domain-containing protein [Spiribacter halobius]|nr:DUF2589 domain-containing protein [Spiribacter halobius]UEX79917.1 DUF4332 domain-containing protein [Spiribacter halobius]
MAPRSTLRDPECQFRAQGLATQESLAFLEQFGLEQDIARTFRFRTERTVEERIVDPETGEPRVVQGQAPFEVSIPRLALVQPPAVQLREMNVELELDVTETRREPLAASRIAPGALATSLAASRAYLGRRSASGPGNMKVSMRITSEPAEGLARLGDLLTDLLSGREPEAAPEPSPSPQPEPDPAPEPPGPGPRPPVSGDVTVIRGIGIARGRELRALGIESVAGFLEATETPEGIRALAGRLNVSEEQIRTWRNAAERL